MDNQKLLDDEFYIGLRQKRATGKEYSDLLEEFMSAVNQNYGEKVLVQFEDFANHIAFELLAKYRTSHLVFNDDIQGTASVLLAGLVASLKLLGGSLADHTFLFLSAREAGTGIAELIALEISTKTSIPVEVARKKIWLVDSKGLIVSSRKGSLQHLKNKAFVSYCSSYCLFPGCNSLSIWVPLLTRRRLQPHNGWFHHNVFYPLVSVSVSSQCVLSFTS
ncbi:putative malate dehydrogenase (oxaloacetate-decarboxylating) (NADP(+)) [Helianthus annuus]|nr:putative malate dehydrogenase (oxaloacetate-decarboxylating) (NADP(+)) [Helianthus annuus]